MSKITFESFELIMSYDLNKKRDPHIEISFCIDGDMDYQASWMGKAIVDDGSKKQMYWYGLTPDCSQAYDFDSFEQFSNAKVFHGKSIKEVWQLVSIFSIDGGQVQEVLPFYCEMA